MVVDKQKGGETHPSPSRPAGAVGPLIFRLAAQLFGGRTNMANEAEWEEQQPEQDPGSEPASAKEASKILERALAQVESMLGSLDERKERPAKAEEGQAMESNELTDLKRLLREVVHRMEDALDHLGIEAQRLSDETSRITLLADRLESRLVGLARSLRQAAPVLEPEPAPEPEIPREPQFQPGDQAIGVIVNAVPGFQELMDMQRGLSDLAAVEGASVSSYRNGEASLELTLNAPVTAREIIDRLGESTSRQLLIEEARPETQRLRLRFIDQQSQDFDESLQRSQPHG